MLTGRTATSAVMKANSISTVLNASLVLFASFLLSMRGLPVRSSCTRNDILDSLKTAYGTLEAIGSGTWIVLRCRKLLHKLLSIVEAYVQRHGDAEAGLEDFQAVQAQPGSVAFPLSIFDWNAVPMDEGFRVNLDHLAFGGDGTALELPIEF